MKYIIPFTIFVLCTHHLYAQTECDHGVSTDPTNPTNNALPINTPSRYLNGTDWIPVDNDGYLMDYPLTNMSFAGVPLTEMSSIYTVNTLPYYNYLHNGPMPLNSNGWELLLVNLGRFPDDVTPIVDGNDFQALPYIVIYNRYTGLIRVFANFGLDATVGDGADAVEVSIQFDIDDDIASSGLMRLYSGHDRALDRTSDVIRMTSITKATNEQKKWFSTDFQIAYDPCTCFYPSELQIAFRQIKTQNITLHGRGITLNNEALVNGTVVNPLDYLGGFDYSGNTADGGMLMYKSLSTLIDDYYAKLEAYNAELVEVEIHNKKVKRNLALLNAAKAVIAIISSGGISTTELLGEQLAGEMAMELAAAETMGMTQAEIYTAYYGLADVNWYDVIKNEYDGIIKTYNKIDTKELFKYVKQIFGEQGSNFIAENFEAKSLPTQGSVPRASFSEMHFEGQITQWLDKSGPTFYTPGTYGSDGTGSPIVNNPHRYPVYNEVLGTFALLKSPKIIISERVNPHSIVNTILQQVNSSPANVIIDFMRYQAWTKEYQFQLAEDLKYAFNSNLDIKDYHIDAAFRIVAKKKRLFDLHEIPDRAYFNCYIDKVLNANIVSNNYDLDIYDPIEARNEPFGYHLEHPDFVQTNYGYWTTPGSPTPIFDILPTDPQSIYHDIESPSLGKETVDLTTTFVPINAFQPLVASLGLKNETRSMSNQWLSTSGDLSSYEITTDCSVNPCVTTVNNLDHPNLVTPNNIDMQSDGFEFEFEVELKLIVDMEFHTLNSEGIPNKSTQIFTYKIQPEDITYMDNTAIKPGVEAGNDNLENFPENLTLSGVNFDENINIHGCSYYTLPGSDLIQCRARNNIYINGELTANASEDVIVDIIASNEIIVDGESDISPSITLFIDPILDYSHPMPQVDLNYVKDFCGNLNNPSDYKAHVPSKLFPTDTNVEGGMTTESGSGSVTIRLYPNPNNGSFILSPSQPLEDLTIQVVDMLGRSVNFNQTKDAAGHYSLILEGAQSGLYNVILSSKEVNQTLRIIVQ